ncbi:zinc ribbon domain-containing protein [Companilactobacillus halodurans]|uniref:Zinc ribbon domain-containing protein n=1 Tax=Companilactobacillus halodurans TaxID=2584183 RepID=A0A5P0ZWJ6_9LACO|nr:zinc ribbon domain-containing protein [Companilactobacillus halodurans]MQS76230.1 zinc ribbon domain-containing protein [Companilactobacillus halodurans]MQS97370.1 zinc ribbon domain-containing protein [Companilactobacillus halodurans]
MKKCKHCGAPLKPGDKFCVKCGTPVEDDTVERTVTDNPSNNSTRRTIDDTVQSVHSATAAAAENINSNETFQTIKKHSLNYFSWYKDSIINPSKVNYENKYYGLVSLLLNVILVSFAIYIIGNRILSFVFESLETAFNYLGSDNSTSTSIPTGMFLYSRLFFIVLVYFAIFLLVGFLCKKYLVSQKTDFFNYSNQLASFSNVMIILELILSLYLLVSVPKDFSGVTGASILGILKFVAVIIVLMSSVWMVAYISSIVSDYGKMRLDKIYVAVITTILCNIVLYFVFKMVFASIQANYSSIGQNIINGVIG